MGVVAAEMPIEFELEALKAQALAARTYITRRIAARDFSNVPVENAWVTDTVTHQAYLSQQDLKNKWKDEAVYKANMEKLQRAVNETKGEILLYNNKPIEAFFFFYQQWVYGKLRRLLEYTGPLFKKRREPLGCSIISQV
ncbi:SpoIID/LytB domain-containing protein [Paenibacillus larvae]|uniref:SpoIID/LytB domain-containing protein n=1 Tax=Paenibacillus larvae TaxID=1464 RepID=UPI0028934CF0|nr:SpoIID/LytB domain-containing protein [Paenibacillus larvae]